MSVESIILICQTVGMAEKKNPLGRTGETTAENVKRLRERQRLTFAELSRILDDLGRPIAQLGLRRIEAGERRIDVDDLVALAAALGVSPITLLMPETSDSVEKVNVTGFGTVSALEFWQWMRTELPVGLDIMHVTENLEFQWRSKPAWLHAEVATRGAGESMSPESIRALADEIERRRDTGRGDGQ
ncbi:helix-turn-helix domain-containing protein [Rhodococcus aetherivorans]|uniref:helix-turn-helix domain-containing protein n=1 Tax=Rhodococcus aetherivorans TaxID=191292 RepID=UPI00241F6FB4|nr:helix-turn-helix transcriptional regulator [Rhodococcus aetherivorans]WFS11847.1 helix-turn-helix transcriptional regulator [Rhodococcus aetherivorans]